MRHDGGEEREQAAGRLARRVDAAVGAHRQRDLLGRGDQRRDIVRRGRGQPAHRGQAGLGGHRGGHVEVGQLEAQLVLAHHLAHDAEHVHGGELAAHRRVAAVFGARVTVVTVARLTLRGGVGRRRVGGRSVRQGGVGWRRGGVRHGPVGRVFRGGQTHRLAACARRFAVAARAHPVAAALRAVAGAHPTHAAERVGARRFLVTRLEEAGLGDHRGLVAPLPIRARGEREQRPHPAVAARHSSPPPGSKSCVYS